MVHGPIAIINTMANLMPAEELIVSPDFRERVSPRLEESSFPPPADSGSSWNFSTLIALLLLFILWAVKLYTTWGAWGNLTVDSGHEMYLPAMLAEGKQLYRDLWFPFGPGAPYFNSYLFRLFGERLNVLYWAGSLSALGSAIFLYLVGMRLSSWVMGWAAAAVLLMEAFQPSIFCFPLPYSFAAAYGCFIGCLFLWLAVNASFSKSWPWVFSAGAAAAVALLLKPEFGLAAYGCLSLLVVARSLFQRSWGYLARGVLATLPGIAICGLVVRWMISIAGVEFITQENILSWPTSYFMKTYGKAYLETTGFTFSGSAFSDAFYHGIPVAVAVLAIYMLLRIRRLDRRSWLLRCMIVLALALYFIKNSFFLLSMDQDLTVLITRIFFPRDMVLYVIIGAAGAWCYHFWRPASARHLAIAVIFSFSGVLAFRIMMKMNVGGYPIFYNGPVVLSYLLLFSMIIPWSDRSRRFVHALEIALCVACLTAVFIHTQMKEAPAKKFVSFSTDRGIIRVSNHMAENYKAAIQFMKDKAALGQSVLSVPEDTSLYFLSGTQCPTRAFLFTPGVVAPGKMTEETIAEIERKPVNYLLWSNRTFLDFSVKEFGTDFNPEIGEYLKSHYRPVGPLIANDGAPTDWAAVVWERKVDGIR
jgi:hypothetical protein